jgi:hypothetical protein
VARTVTDGNGREPTLPNLPDGANGAYRLLTRSASSIVSGTAAEGSAADRGLATWAARINRCRAWHAGRGGRGPGGQQGGVVSSIAPSSRSAKQSSSTFVPDIDLLGLQVGRGTAVPERLVSVLCAPWALPPGTFFQTSEAEAGEVAAGAGFVGQSLSPTRVRKERLSLVVVAVNRQGGGRSLRPSSEGGGGGGGGGSLGVFNDNDMSLAQQCARHLALRCAMQAARARHAKESQAQAAVADAGLVPRNSGSLPRARALFLLRAASPSLAIARARSHSRARAHPRALALVLLPLPHSLTHPSQPPPQH